MAINSKFAAYKKAQNTGLKFSDLERRVFMEAARKLDDAYKSFNPEAKDHPAARDALRFNWRLWTLIQNDVGHAENPLNDDLRLKLLELSAYVDQQTLKFSLEPQANILATFRDLLQNIAQGPDRSEGEASVSSTAPSPHGTQQTDTLTDAPAPRPLGGSFTV